jgi:hypothetical protein
VGSVEGRAPPCCGVVVLREVVGVARRLTASAALFRSGDLGGLPGAGQRAPAVGSAGPGVPLGVRIARFAWFVATAEAARLLLAVRADR